MREANAQGEVYFYQVDKMPTEGVSPAKIEKTSGGDWIISHSESGNHHVIDGECDVLEKTQNVPAGMSILYALVKNPGQLRQEGGVGTHESHDLDPGIYEIRIKRERQPFAEQVRRVVD